MEQEIRDVIEKQLPSQVGTVLRDQLEKGEKAIEKVDKLDNELLSVQHSLNLSEKKNRELSLELDQHHNLDFRESEITLREQILELKEQHAEEKVELVQNCFNKIFANRKIRESVQQPVVTSYYTQEGYDHQGNPNIKRNESVEWAENKTSREES